MINKNNVVIARRTAVARAVRIAAAAPIAAASSMQPNTCVSPRLMLEHEPPPPAGTAPFYVHQTWKTCELPFAQARWRDRCKHILPNTTKFFVWTDAHLRELVAEEFPLHQGVYDSYDAHIKRVDAVCALPIRRRLHGPRLHLHPAAAPPLRRRSGDAAAADQSLR